LPEPSSRSVRAFVEQRDQPVLLNELQELEFKNGLRQKVLRKEITEPELVRSLRVFEDDCVAERIQRKPVLWQAVYQRAETLSRRFSMKQICRSFDLMHVAIAVTSKVRHFATLDVEQAKMARVTGLKLVEFPSVSQNR
jgi:hypothetical protein